MKNLKKIVSIIMIIMFLSFNCMVLAVNQSDLTDIDQKIKETKSQSKKQSEETVLLRNLRSF